MSKFLRDLAQSRWPIENDQHTRDTCISAATHIDRTCMRIQMLKKDKDFKSEQENTDPFTKSIKNNVRHSVTIWNIDRNKLFLSKNRQLITAWWASGWRRDYLLEQGKWRHLKCRLRFDYPYSFNNPQLDFKKIGGIPFQIETVFFLLTMSQWSMPVDYAALEQSWKLEKDNWEKKDPKS